jgi:hypothetical protein
MNNDEELVTWPERCLTCAYRDGTEASKSEATLLKARLCMESGELFLCHADPSRRAICKGWVDAFAVRLHSGKLQQDPWRRELAAAMAQSITDAEDAILASQHDEAKRLYEAACERLDHAMNATPKEPS